MKKVQTKNNAFQREKLPKLMSQYEQDLTWMAYRYAIGRHTIHADCMCKDMCKHIPGRVTPERSRFMAEDIQREIAMHLRFYPFTFSVVTYPEDMLLVPLDYLIAFYNQQKMSKLEDLYRYAGILCFVDSDEITFKSFLSEEKEKKVVSGFSMDIDDLMNWSNLSKLLDDRCHHFALCKKSENLGERIVVEYFDSYVRVQDAEERIRFELVKIPCAIFSNNAYMFCQLNEDWIVKDKLTPEEVGQYKLFSV